MTFSQRIKAAFSAVFPLRLNKTVMGLKGALGDARDQHIRLAGDILKLKCANRDLHFALQGAEEDLTAYLKAELDRWSPLVAFGASSRMLMGDYQTHQFEVRGELLSHRYAYTADLRAMPSSFFDALAERESRAFAAAMSKEIRNQLKKAFNK